MNYFLNLPKVLIIHITKFLDFNEIINFIKTSKNGQKQTGFNWKYILRRDYHHIKSSRIILFHLMDQQMCQQMCQQMYLLLYLLSKKNQYIFN